MKLVKTISLCVLILSCGREERKEQVGKGVSLELQALEVLHSILATTIFGFATSVMDLMVEEHVEFSSGFSCLPSGYAEASGEAGGGSISFSIDFEDCNNFFGVVMNGRLKIGGKYTELRYPFDVTISSENLVLEKGLEGGKARIRNFTIRLTSPGDPDYYIELSAEWTYEIFRPGSGFEEGEGKMSTNIHVKSDLTPLPSTELSALIYKFDYEVEDKYVSIMDSKAELYQRGGAGGLSFKGVAKASCGKSPVTFYSEVSLTIGGECADAIVFVDTTKDFPSNLTVFKPDCGLCDIVEEPLDTFVYIRENFGPP